MNSLAHFFTHDESLVPLIGAGAMLYDRVQLLAGQPVVRWRIQSRITVTSSSPTILDLGGGTGLYRTLWPKSAEYVCLDIDPAKLKGYRVRYPRGLAILADGGTLPLRDNSFDVVACIAVAHHLPTDRLDRMLRESKRVLKPKGSFVFLDAVREPFRLASRALWLLDRGSQARSTEELQATLSRSFCKSHGECFAVIHKYLLWIGSPL